MLSQEPLHVDEIRSQIGLPIEKISAALTMMELNGMVRQVGGMNYISVREENASYLVEEELGQYKPVFPFLFIMCH